jgi:anti-sigma regulatory factor (Ser/Thr protein kinase)
MAECIVQASLEHVDEVLDFIEESSSILSMKEQTQLRIVAEEIFVNIASYAYSPGNGTATIRVNAEESAVTVEFADTGKAYNPLEHEDPDVSLPAEERDIGGLGLLMVKKMTDHIAYVRDGDTNILTIRKDHHG